MKLKSISLRNSCWLTVIIVQQVFPDLINAHLSPLDDYILHHEGLIYDTNRLHNLHVRATRSVEEYVHLQFRAFRRTFHLQLQPDNSIFRANHQLRFDGSTSRDQITIAYNGNLKNVPGSSVKGSIINGIFRGEIHQPGADTFYIEPSNRFFRGSPPYHSVIYSSDHLILEPYRHLRNGSHSCGVSRDHHHHHDEPIDNEAEYGSESAVKEEVLRRYRRQSINGILSGTKESKNTCTLEMRSDPYLFQYVSNPKSLGGMGYTDAEAARDEILSLFVSHVNALNEIFRKTRFATNDDQTWFQGINFAVQRTEIMTMASEKCSSSTEAGKFCKSNYDVNALLYQSSLDDHSSFCLSYMFTYRDFQKGTLGLAWVAKPSSRTTGGLCEPYQESTEANNKRVKKSLNTGVVSLINYGKRVALRVSHLTFAHEVGHSFGAEHDATSECAPFGTTRPDADKGNYIMYASANPGGLLNNDNFSPCSGNYIAQVLFVIVNNQEGKRNCFKKSNSSYCGNTIVEAGEECDCGFERDCTENCCNPSGHTNECHLKVRSDVKVKCSPSQGPCCDTECNFITTTNYSCSPGQECAFASHCNGFNGSCPADDHKEDLTFCEDNTLVCQQGECAGSICKKIEWEECFVVGDWRTQADDMCYVSCKAPGTNDCISSNNQSAYPTYPKIKELMEHVGNGKQGVKLIPGSPCNNFQGYCDVFQKCRKTDADGALKRLFSYLDPKNLATVAEWIQEKWWAVLLMGIGLVLLMAGFIKLCAYKTPSSNPAKNQRQHDRHPRQQQQHKEIRNEQPMDHSGPPPDYDYAVQNRGAAARSYGDQSYGDRSYGDRSYGDGSYGDRGYGDHRL